MSEATKQCTKCHETKPLDAFHKQTTGHAAKDGRRSVCKACRADVKPPVDPVPDGFELRGVATEVGADGQTKSQWLQSRTEATTQEEIKPAVPLGHYLKGVSTLVDESGNVRAQWIKTNVEQQQKMESMLEAMSHIADRWEGLHDPVPERDYHNEDLLCVYPMGDPHLGMFAWPDETGDAFDLRIAERNLCAAVDQLVTGAPDAGEALIINVGDFFHSDNSQNQTARSHHALDVDTRWGKVLRVGIRTMRRCIDRTLEKHQRVRVICEIGNHDDHSSVMLAHCLDQYYERDPRVKIDTSPAKFHWYRFGTTLIGSTHGDTVKLAQLPGVMAVDRKVDWGETDYRYFYTGHVHHDSLHEFPGVIVETLRTLAPKDAYAAGAGYRAGQDMKCDVIHRRFGRIQRNTVGISQIKE
jgi:hypothetical protein